MLLNRNNALLVKGKYTVGVRRSVLHAGARVPATMIAQVLPADNLMTPDQGDNRYEDLDWIRGN
ncbi:hypothetical protein [Beggiatoa leptomitoformis]|uniref:Uncharacterized protein n=1 Tax=Beggiatoa leptomitoformis TaxID=288004 RepID=A0A2N9YD27_9GAMM|nr:hypothetical protein [Beggiatoa leptomitoformis]ALG69186.1 hypothetical protein AL038_17700 [Beggiatoa leptomitoformis]AUI68388.1 hypothetical protein BLE401_06530 [Beggiatoa leptomitoformis]